MQTEKKLWLLACVVFIACAAFSVFAGFSIAGMTKRQNAEPAAETDEAEDPFETADEETDDPLETLPEEPETEEEPEETEPESLQEPVAGNIHKLSEAELAAVETLCSGEVTTFHSAGDRDAENRPIYLNELSADYTETFKNVRIYNGDTQRSVSFVFILTAENGQNTEFILNHLLQRGIKATFFVDYYYATQNQGLILRMIEEGHEIGSLGYSLPEGGIAYASLAEQQEDAIQLQDAVKDLFSYDMKKYYFGYEAYSDQSLALMTQMGYTVTFFSVNYPDYNATEPIDTEGFLTEMKNELHPNAIYCLHTVNSATVDMLPQLLDYITESGYTISLIQ